jgi:hypothetical protein
MGEHFEANRVSEYVGVWKLLFDWQTLITGGTAIVAASIAAWPVWRQLKRLNVQSAGMARDILARRISDIELRRNATRLATGKITTGTASSQHADRGAIAVAWTAAIGATSPLPAGSANNRDSLFRVPLPFGRRLVEQVEKYALTGAFLDRGYDPRGLPLSCKNAIFPTKVNAVLSLRVVGLLPF